MANKQKVQEETVKPGFAASVDMSNLPDFDKWSDDQIGYAPYWHPDPNDLTKFFFGTPIARDERDPKFVRYLFVSAMDGLICQRGPNEARAEAQGRDVEYVTVNKGDTFSISAYAGPEDVLTDYLEFQAATGETVFVRMQAKEKVPTNNSERPWFWRWHAAKIEPAQMQRLKQWRLENKMKNKQLASKANRPSLES